MTATVLGPAASPISREGTNDQSPYTRLTKVEPMNNHDGTAVRSPNFVVGIDLGGTKIRGGIATTWGAIIADRKVETQADDLIGQIARLVASLCQDADADIGAVVATGIGGAGVPDSVGGTFGKAPNLAGVDGESFAGQLAEVLGHRVVIENDVNVAALGELKYGVGLAHRDFVFVSVGTGIGMGVVSNGMLVRGAHGAAGEIGFLPMGADPFDPRTRRRGALEEVVAGDALTGRYRDATGTVVTAEEVFARAAKGDVAAIATLDEQAKWLATAIVAVDAMLDPHVVVLGGGIGSRADLLLMIRGWLDRLGASAIDVRISELGSRAPVAGAVLLALDAARPSGKGTV